MARLHGKGDQTASVAAEQHSRGAEDSGAQIDLALLPVFAQGAEPHRREKDQERSALRGVLVHVQQIGQRGDKDDSATDAEKTDEDADSETEDKNDSNRHQQIANICIMSRIRMARQHGTAVRICSIAFSGVWVSGLKRLMNPALLLSLLGLAMTLRAMVQLRPYIHGRYMDPRVWNEQPVGCIESFVGLLCVAIGFWLFFAERDSDEDDQKNKPRA